MVNADALDPHFRKGIDARKAKADAAHELVAVLSARAVQVPAGGLAPAVWAKRTPIQKRKIIAGFVSEVRVAKGASGDLPGHVRIVWFDGSEAEHHVRELVA
jgi:hypothetical protein